MDSTGPKLPSQSQHIINQQVFFESFDSNVTSHQRLYTVTDHEDYIHKVKAAANIDLQTPQEDFSFDQTFHPQDCNSDQQQQSRDGIDVHHQRTQNAAAADSVKTTCIADDGTCYTDFVAHMPSFDKFPKGLRYPANNPTSDTNSVTASEPNKELRYPANNHTSEAKCVSASGAYKELRYSADNPTSDTNCVTASEAHEELSYTANNPTSDTNCISDEVSRKQLRYLANNPISDTNCETASEAHEELRYPHPVNSHTSDTNCMTASEAHKDLSYTANNPTSDTNCIPDAESNKNLSYLANNPISDTNCETASEAHEELRYSANNPSSDTNCITASEANDFLRDSSCLDKDASQDQTTIHVDPSVTKQPIKEDSIGIQDAQEVLSGDQPKGERTTARCTKPKRITKVNESVIPSTLGLSSSCVDKKNSNHEIESPDFVTVTWLHFKCKECGETFQERKFWKKHLISIHNLKPYVCMYCDERFDRKADLQDHNHLHEVGFPQTQPEKPKTKEATNLKLTIRVSRNNKASKVNTVKPQSRSPFKNKISTSRGKRKTVSILKKKKQNSGSKSSKTKQPMETSFDPQDNGIDIKTCAENRTRNQNKRKRGPVLRYVPEDGEPVKRNRRQVVKDFSCDHCPKRFTSNQAKLLHEKSHKRHKCNMCDKDFKWKRELVKHEAGHKNTSKKQSSKYQPKSVKNDADKKEDDSDGDKDYGVEDDTDDAESSDNGSDTDYATDKDEDEQADNDDQDGPFKCQFCPRLIKKRRNLTKHEKTHDDGTPHTCSHCQKVYVRRRDLKRHMVRHTTDKPYQCDQCKKRFKHEAGLQKHARLHTGEGLLVCQYCGKKYNGKGSLKAHERIHTGEKPYKCQYCDKWFGTQTAQKYHELEHTGGLICHICGRQFKSKHNLQEHERIHSGERPYKCGRCDMAFMSVGARRYHMNTHNGDEHWCDVCTKKFTCKASLDAHKFTHTGLHPYACKFCPKHFNSISGVRGHEKQVHLGMKRKHKTKAQKVLERALVSQKKLQVNRALTKKELKSICDAAKAATISEQEGTLKPGRKPRTAQVTKDNLVPDFTNPKGTKLNLESVYNGKLLVEAPSGVSGGMPKKHFSKVLQGIHDVAEYPTRVVIGEQDSQIASSTTAHPIQQSMPVDYSSTTYVSSALQKAIGLIPRVHGNAMTRGHNNAMPHSHTTPWPGQHIGNSHLDTMVESLVQFSKNY